jgi:hypothetical protein
MSEERRLNEDWRPMTGNDRWPSEEWRLCEYGSGSRRTGARDLASIATRCGTRHLSPRGLGLSVHCALF